MLEITHAVSLTKVSGTTSDCEGCAMLVPHRRKLCPDKIKRDHCQWVLDVSPDNGDKNTGELRRERKKRREGGETHHV